MCVGLYNHLGVEVPVERDGTIRRIQEGWKILTSGFVQSVALSPDDTRLVLSIQGPPLDLWKRATDGHGSAVPVFPGLTSNQGDVSPDGRWVVYREGRDLKAPGPGPASR